MAKKILRVIISPLSLISKDLGKIQAAISTAFFTAVAGPAAGAAFGSIANYAYSKSPKAPKPSQSDRDRLLSTINPRAFRTICFGNTALGNDIVDQEFTGTNQEFLHRFIVHSGHKLTEVTSIYFDAKLAWTFAGGVQPDFAGYLTVAPILEGSAANAINISARMGATRRLTGLGYTHLRFKLTGNTKKTESPFASAVPSRITFVGKGLPCYDPRRDSSVGGVGTHRADDQTTWAWDEAGSRNPALQALTFMLGWRINGKLSVGKGIPARRFDMQAFMTAANICDEAVALTAGGTEPRYRSDGVFSEGDEFGTVLGTFAATMDARFHDPRGRIAVKCMVNDLASAIPFGEDDILGAVQWNPFAELSESYNIVRGTYTDPSVNSLYQSVEYPEQSAASVDGIDRILTLDLPLVQSPSQAQRLARRARLRALYGGGSLSCEMQATAWRLSQYDIAALNFAPLGMAGKLFRVEEISVNVDGVVPITLSVEDSRIYAEAGDVAPIAPVPVTPYDPANNPFVVASVAAEQSYILSSYTTDADPSDGLLQATSSAITIENHTRAYIDIASPVSVTGATLTLEDDGITAIVDETLYHIYYDDAARAGGAVTLKATRDPQVAANSGSNPARHYVGTIATDVIGGTGTSAGGSIPPGWNSKDWYNVAP